MSRRFTIGDLMIIIIALGVGFSGGRTLFMLRGMPALWWGLEGVYTAVWPMVTGSLAMLAMRLRQPRPRRPRLMCQPGWVASLAVSLTALYGLVVHTLIGALGRCVHVGWSVLATREYAWHEFAQWSYRAQVGCPLAVTIAWSILALGGRWRAEPSWMDRSGRVLGWLWIAYPLIIEAASAGPASAAAFRRLL
jgi:hypothetical protein